MLSLWFLVIDFAVQGRNGGRSMQDASESAVHGTSGGESDHVRPEYLLVLVPVHLEIQHKKPHFQHKLYQECGFLYWISGRSSSTSGSHTPDLDPPHPFLSSASHPSGWY
eukprot:2020263-Rhodomonas_salina.1